MLEFFSCVGQLSIWSVFLSPRGYRNEMMIEMNKQIICIQMMVHFYFP